MVARMWHGRVSAEKEEEYHAYIQRTGLKDFADTKGNRGALLLTRKEGEITHFYTLSFWEDMNAICLFAGHEPEKARYYPEDADYLLELEPRVAHFEVASATWPV